MPDIYFDVDVAISEAPVNVMPLIDDTDFKTREESVAYNAGGMDLVWNFVTTAGAFTQTAVTPTTAGDYDWTNQGNGMYTIEIPASGGASINNDTEGFGWFTGFATGILPWRGPTIGFRAATINDALIDDGTALITAKDIGLIFEDTIGTVTGQAIYDMDTDIVANTNWDGLICAVEDVTTGDIFTTYVTAVDTANDRINVAQAPDFTVAIADKVRVYAREHPEYSLNTYDPPTDTEFDAGVQSILEKMLAYFRLALRGDAAPSTDDAAELTAINGDGGSGAGTFDPTTDASEAKSDKIVDLTDGTTPVHADVRKVLGNTLTEGASDNDRKVGY